MLRLIIRLGINGEAGYLFQRTKIQVRLEVYSYRGFHGVFRQMHSVFPSHSGGQAGEGRHGLPLAPFLKGEERGSANLLLR